MPYKENMILKVHATVYADHESLIKKVDGCRKISEKSSATKVAERTLSDFSISMISLFKSTKNKHDVCRGEDSTEKLCK